MIPYRLRLTHFLSYQHAVLDFRGLHTACICGANGAGKSSLLEAMTWALWGQSRGAVEDDVIHLGASEVCVDFLFQHQEQFYRVIRSRHRHQATVLEFQVAHLASSDLVTSDLAFSDLAFSDLTFRSLTAKGLRATQQLIIQTIKLDYETFISSAYLRQGRADEFMLKRPSERKQVLADLLKLDQYDRLAEKAKEQARTYRAQAQTLGQSLAMAVDTQQQLEHIGAELTILTASLEALQDEQTRDRDRLTQLTQLQLQHHTWQQQQRVYQQEQQRLAEMGDRLLQEQADLEARQTQQQQLLEQSSAIEAGYDQWQALQASEVAILQRAEQYHLLEARRHQSQQRFEQERFDIQRQIERVETQCQALDRQVAALQPILLKADEIEQALGQLEAARDKLHRLNQLEAEVSPLLQRHQTLEIQIKQAYTQLATRLESLQQQQQALESQQTWLPQIQAEYETTKRQVAHLEARQSYRNSVLDKGMERRSFLDRLKAHLLDYETQLMQVEVSTAELMDPDRHCPQCDRPFDDIHRTFSQNRLEHDRQALIDLITIITDQISVSKKEITVLRDEYRAIGRELKGYPEYLQRQGQLRQQLTASVEIAQQHQVIACESQALQTQLANQNYSPELQREWQQLQAHLAQLGYDDRNHAIARGEMERWRWAQIKQSELRQAQRQLKEIDEQRPALELQLKILQQQLQKLDDQAQRNLGEITQQLVALDYNPKAHSQLRQSLQAAQIWQLRHQALQQAQLELPLLQVRAEAIATQWAAHDQAAQESLSQLQMLQQKLIQLDAQIYGQTHAQIHRQTHAQAMAVGMEVDMEIGSGDIPQQANKLSVVLQALDTQIADRQPRLDRYFAQQGRLQQQQQHLKALCQQSAQQQIQLQHYQYQQRVHQELAQAFGKNGIQALMIENILPQLERETNQILARLSNHQLHVQFITQKSKQNPKQKARPKSSTEAHFIDTLDIRIADAKGTRPYETYSGGEAFRVNFSIRLALARLLAQRSGTALQLLIVDEGFGTQDTEGCDRLIAAINAIAPDFARILTITHMPQFKEAFQARIEVSKTDVGSTLAIAF
ncbi:MAG: AAA family ATPase [Synechococcales cyanobacterium CRU_2_2]|nr:AAA family ATPase [Synechococcales cyanobacterium CRU_2_2]